MALHPVDLKDLDLEPFRIFGTRNALLTAGDRDRCNPMTIGWCQVGRIWNVPTCTVYVRPERYTYRLMEEKDFFTVSVLPEERRADLQFCGTRSGRDVDKIASCGLTVRYGAGDAPFFEEAERVLVCRKLFVQDMRPENVLPAGEEIVLPFYGANGGWHRIYTGKIEEAYTK